MNSAPLTRMPLSRATSTAISATSTTPSGAPPDRPPTTFGIQRSRLHVDAGAGIDTLKPVVAKDLGGGSLGKDKIIWANRLGGPGYIWSFKTGVDANTLKYVESSVSRPITSPIGSVPLVGWFDNGPHPATDLSPKLPGHP